MARKCKCKYCGKQLTTDIAWVYEYLTDDLEIKKKYYCNEDCYKAEEKAKLIQEDCFEKLDNLLGFKTKSNIYFRKLLKDITEVYDYEVLQKYLINESNNIELALGRIDFTSTNNKINYFMTILQNNIDNYKKVFEEQRIQEVAKEIEIIESVSDINVTQRRNKRDRKKRRSLDELF